MRRLGDLLIEMKLCTPEAVRFALENQAILGGRLGTNLLDLGLVAEPDLAKALQAHYGIPCLHGPIEISQETLEAVPRELVDRYEVVPYAVNDRKLTLLVCDPRDFPALDAVAFAVGKSIRPLVAPQVRIWALMRQYYGLERELRGIQVDFDSMGPVQRPSSPRQAPAPEVAPRSLPETPIDEAELAALLQERMPDGARPPASARDIAEMGRFLDQGTGGDVLRALLSNATARYRRAIILSVYPGNPGVAVGWQGQGEGVDGGDARRVIVPLRGESIIDQAVSYRAPVLGPLPWNEANRKLIEDLGGGGPRDVLVVPILVFGRAMAVLYVDDGPGQTIEDDVDAILLLAGKAGRMLEAKQAAGAAATAAPRR